jgi:hypothetical protein
MSDKKISQLNAITDLTNNDEFVVVDSGETKKILFSNLQKEIVNYLAPTSITVSATNNVDLDSSTFHNSEIIKLSWSGGAGNMTMTLPDCTSTNNTNRAMRFISDSTFSTNTRVYLKPATGQNLDGSTNYYEINKSYEGIKVWSDGTEWFIIQKKA